MTRAPTDEVWLDRFARLVGFGRLAQLLPGSPPPSYVYAVTTVIVSSLVVDAYDLYVGDKVIYEINPYFVLLPIGMIGATYGARSLHRIYDQAVDEMKVRERATEPGSLISPFPSWLPWTIFFVGAGLQLIRSVIALNAYDAGDIFANFVVFPFVYMPILAGFFSVYLGIEVIAPWRLANSDLGIHFLDPEGVGGFRPIGEVVKKAYYYVVAGLIAGALITYAPFVESQWSVVTFASLVFTAVWVVSIFSVGFAVYKLHQFMYREKRAEKRRLEEQLLEHLKHPWDIAEYEIPEDHQSEVEEIRQRMARVSETREYPATFSIWSQLLLTIILPKAFQMLIASV